MRKRGLQVHARVRPVLNIGIVVGVLLGGVVLLQPFYLIQEGQVALITQFGEIIKTNNTAGLYVRAPFLHHVHKYTAKLLRVDGDPQKIPTKEKQFIEVDTTSRWRIEDVKKFYQSLGTYEAAYSRISDIIDSSVRDIITVNGLDDVVRSTNAINESNHSEQFDVPVSQLAFDRGAEKTAHMTIEKGRESLAREISQAANDQLKDFGIVVVDVIFKGIKYSDELQASVFNRMVKERNQIAQMFRSTGEGKKAEWLGKLDNEKRSLLSKAYEEIGRAHV